LIVTGDGKTGYVLVQAALNPESGTSKKSRRYTRFVKDDTTVLTAPRNEREFVRSLPLYNDPMAKVSNTPDVAAQAEIFHLLRTVFHPG
jgi:hypothetical protein